MGFAQGVSALSASAANLDVIGNNIANSGTIGFKSGSVQFADVYAGSRVGLGTQVSGVAQNFTSGAVQSSTRALDVAITNGDGFFRLASAGGEISYSRNGQFNVDKEGFLVNAAGLQLTGFPVAANGAIAGGAPVALQFPTTGMAPKPTDAIAAQFNLDSRSKILPATGPAFDAKDPATYNYSNAVNIYDSLGNSHELATFFVKTTPTTWDMYATADGVAVKGTATAIAAATAAAATATAADVAAAAVAAAAPLAIAAATAATAAATADTTAATSAATYASTNLPADKTTADSDTAAAVTANAAAALAAALAAADPIAVAAATAAAVAAAATANVAAVISGGKNGQLTFDSNGVMTAPAGGTMSFAGLQFPNGSTAMAFDMNITGTTQFGNDNQVNKLTQTGYTSGVLTSYAIGQDGIVTGKYSNEQSNPLGQIVLSSFINPNGLQLKGDNVWAETSASGQPLTGKPGSGTKLGALTAGALEGSNVDLTSELVNLIIAQRTYQANSQTVKTQDQVMQTLINMR